MCSLDRRSRTYGWAGLALVLITTLLAGMVSVAAPATAQGIETKVRFLHASPDRGNIEVSLDGDEELDEFAYGSTSDWLEVEPGPLRVTISEERPGTNSAVFDTVYPITAGGHYNVVLTDELVIASPINRDPLPADTARVHIVHASVDVPELDVAVVEGDVVVSSLAYGERSPEVEVPAGSYDFEVRLTESADVVLTLPGTVLQAGMVYEVVAMGLPDSADHPLTATPLVDDVLEGDPVASPEA